MSEEKVEVERFFLQRDSWRKSVRVKPSKFANSQFYGLWRSNCSFSKYLQIIVRNPQDFEITWSQNSVYRYLLARKNICTLISACLTFTQNDLLLIIEQQKTANLHNYRNVLTFSYKIVLTLCHHSTFLEKGAPPYGFLALWTSQYHKVLKLYEKVWNMKQQKSHRHITSLTSESTWFQLRLVLNPPIAHLLVIYMKNGQKKRAKHNISSCHHQYTRSYARVRSTAMSLASFWIKMTYLSQLYNISYFCLSDDLLGKPI